jgi:hypothetical protein
MDLPFLAGLSNVDMIILIGAGIVFLVLAYMIFKQIVKAVIIGAISASIPVVLYLLGFDIGLNIQTVIWFGLAGIATYFVYDVINGWMTVIRIITWPIRRALRKPASQPKEKEGKPKDFSPKEDKKDAKGKEKEKS